MDAITSKTYIELKTDPSRLRVVAEAAAATKDAEGARKLNTAVFRTLASLILDRRWIELGDFTTSLIHAAKAFERAVATSWESARPVATDWDSLIRLSTVVLDMTRDEQALDFAEAKDIHGLILEALREREPQPSGELAGAIGKSAQQVSNALAGMEDHHLVSRHAVGKKTLVWLGAAGHYYLEKMPQPAVAAAAPKETFDVRFAQERQALRRQGSNLPAEFKKLQRRYTQSQGTQGLTVASAAGDSTALDPI